MPTIIETEVFQFDELADKAKEKARDWFREGSMHDDWYDATFEDAVQCAAEMGIAIGTKTQRYHVMGRDGKPGRNGTQEVTEIYFSGFSSQGDGASFAGVYTYKADAVEAIKAHAPLDTKLHEIAERLVAAQALGPVCESVTVTQRGNYSHSGSMDFEFNDEDESVALSEIAPDTIRESEKEIISALRSFADWIYRQLEKEYEWQNADEQVDDNIRANEYTFTVNGKRFG